MKKPKVDYGGPSLTQTRVELEEAFTEFQALSEKARSLIKGKRVRIVSPTWFGDKRTSQYGKVFVVESVYFSPQCGIYFMLEGCRTAVYLSEVEILDDRVLTRFDVIDGNL